MTATNMCSNFVVSGPELTSSPVCFILSMHLSEPTSSPVFYTIYALI